MNIYNFTGRLGRDSETRTTQSGITICSFTVAVDYGYGENKGTNWLRCSLFGKRAEGQLPKYLVKGTQVAISGELRIREYDDREGARRTSTEVSVDKLDLIGGRNDNQGQAPQGQQPQQQGGFPTHGGQPTQQPQAPYNPNAQGMPVDDDIPF